MLDNDERKIEKNTDDTKEQNKEMVDWFAFCLYSHRHRLTDKTKKKRIIVFNEQFDGS
jgi:hypothetical protein